MSDTETLTEQDIATDTTPELSSLAVEDGSVEDSSLHSPTELCGNCATPLLGPHCYSCGQPAKSLIRQFPELIADFFGTVFGLDSRIARTFGPLLFNPGFLTTEYLAGRRVRYVSPVRLFVFLCLTAFFVAQLSSDWRIGSPATLQVDNRGNAGINLDAVESKITLASSVDEVIQLRDEALEEIAAAERESQDIPGMSGVLAGVEQVVRTHAQKRIAEIDPTSGSGEVAATDGFTPLQIDGLPDSVNAWLERKSTKLISNLPRIEQDPNLLKDALFSAIPSTLFLLLPIFAFLLSVAYVFKRRLYMEHLIVALHSHAFLSLALLLSVLLFDLRQWIAPPTGTLIDSGFTLVLTSLVAWMPIYLLLMQKRVYQQSWSVTVFKFTVLGTGYLLLLGSAALLTALASMVNL